MIVDAFELEIRANMTLFFFIQATIFLSSHSFNGVHFEGKAT